MATTVIPEDIAPLLVKEEIDNVSKESESQVECTTATTNSGTGKLFGFLFQRSTYYWITFIAQFSHLVLCVLGFAVARASKDTKKENNYTSAMFLTSGIYSGMNLIPILILLGGHYLKGTDVGPKRINAGKHYSLAKTCAFLNILNFIFFLLPGLQSHNEQTYSDEVRPIIVPLIVGFIFVATLSIMTAAHITYKSAKRARGIEQVPDPDYKVPAWTLATTAECRGYTRENAIQLP